MLPALLGRSKQGRDILIEQGGALSIIKDQWKYIRPDNGDAYYVLTGIESGNAPNAQLYDLKNDMGEKNNLAEKYPEKVKALSDLLKKIKGEN